MKPTAAGNVECRFARVIRSTPQEARIVVRGVAAWLDRNGASPDIVGSVQIAVAEAVNNLVEHGARTSDDRIRVTGQFRPARCVSIEICDSGHGLPDGVLPAGRCAPRGRSAADLPEGGYGWHLIRELTARIRYRRSGNCNTLTLDFDPQPR